MTLAVAWIVLPLVLALLSLGCGLLLETVSGMRLPGALLLPGGFIVVSLAAYFAHMTDTTARLQVPLVIALAIAGYGVSRPWKRLRLDRWLTGAATGVYAVFAAPVVLSGKATFSGYIRLDDTATYMSMLDRATTHAYDVSGLHSSTYKAVLHFGYVFGYPLGSLLPLDVGSTIVRVDPLWLWQPYLSFLAVMIALGLYQLVSGFVQSRALRACVAFFGAQAALMYGYALWGGVKELFVPGVILFAACLVPRVRAGGPRQVIPLAAASAAVISGQSVGGGIWVLPLLAVGLVLLVRSRPLEAVLQTVGVYLLTTGVLAIPILSVSARRLNHISKFTKGGSNGIGNLHHPLGWWQLFGIWPSGDFRDKPTSLPLTHLLAVLVGLCAIVAVVAAWRRGHWEVVVALGTGLFACIVYVETASPWVAGKALAASSPLVLGVGLAGVAVLIEGGRRMEGGAALAAVAVVPLAVIAAAVLWSNTLQYHAVLLAPSDRMAELEKIGSMFNHKGPGLLTELEPYGARHFLRGLDGEATTELRVHYVCVRRDSPYGSFVPGACYEGDFGSSPDVDDIRLDQLLYYRTLIVRRTGATSRPPSSYTRAWAGRYYDVWQRPKGNPGEWVKAPGPSRIIKHMSLGSAFQPAAVPDCARVMQLADIASAAHGVLATVYRPQAVVIQTNGEIGSPKRFGFYGELAGNLRFVNAYHLTLPFSVSAGGKYTLWVGGSFNSTVTAKIDGRKVGQQANQTEWPGNFLSFGSLKLARGAHTLEIKHSGPGLGPGSAAKEPFGLGPFVVAQGTDQRAVTYVQPNRAHSLCGKSLDWIEALSG